MKILLIPIMLILVQITFLIFVLLTAGSIAFSAIRIVQDKCEVEMTYNSLPFKTHLFCEARQARGE